VGAVQARWSQPAVDIPDGDPFAPTPSTASPRRKIEEVGTPIDVSGERATLNARLARLVDREGELYQVGVECAIKNRDDTSCHACPISQSEADTPLGELCRIGCKQEVACTALAAARCTP
jgi:hypothetical protein